MANDRLDGVVANAAIKVPCRVATTAAITLSDLQTIDGVAVVAGDRVLVKDQADAKENGIYGATTGTWSRTADCDGNRDLVRGTLVYAYAGTANTGYWYCTTDDDIVVGTSEINWGQASTTLAVISAWGQTLIDDADAAAGRVTLGGGTTAATGDQLFLTTGSTQAQDLLNPWVAQIQRTITNATSATTGTNLPAYGLVTLDSSDGDTFILDDPALAGYKVELVVISTDTNTITVTAEAANIQTTGGSSFISADFDSEGEALQLVALTTVLWGVTSNVGGVTFTT